MDTRATSWERLLAGVTKPTRYIGAEWNLSPLKVAAPVRFALAYPDAYEVGMSNNGIQVLYQILAQRDDVLVDRCYAPWTDMEEQLRRTDQPLRALQSGLMLSEFTVVGFSLQYELNYSNILTMLDLGRVPLHAEARTAKDPLVIGGGPCAHNPEALVDFFDGFLLGDGEEAIGEIIDTIRKVRASTDEREALLTELAKISGFYVPKFLSVAYASSGRIASTTWDERQPMPYVQKRVVRDLEAAPYPMKPLVALSNVVHDRVSIEVARGCHHLCRFCPAGMTSKPVRQRTSATVKKLAINSLMNTGHSELSLAAFNLPDYPELPLLVTELMTWCTPRRISLALPSFRPGGLTPELIGWILSVRKTGFTMAPEAGNLRLRAIINKNITDEQLLANVRDVFASGWNLLKLYFMVGLPGETQDDLAALVDLVRKVLTVGRSVSTRNVTINVSISPFVPKPHTPFQWFAQDGLEVLEEKLRFLRQTIPRKAVKLKATDPKISRLEAAFSNSDRRLGVVLETAWRLGCRFDGWSEEFREELWEQAFADCGRSMAEYANRQKEFTEILPWRHLQSPARNQYIQDDALRALKLFDAPPAPPEPIDLKQLATEATAPGSDLKPLPPIIVRDPIQLIRAVYQKQGLAKFLSHLDWIRLIEQAIRRAQLPIAYTAGFNPHPKVAYGPPLPVGAESLMEMLDVNLTKRLSVDSFITTMNSQLPEGVKFVRARILPLHTPSITSMIQATCYRVEVPEDVREAQEQKGLKPWHELFKLTTAQKITVPGFEFDLKPYLIHYAVSPESERQISVTVTIAHGSPATIRPLELVGNTIGLDNREVRELPLVRLAFYIDKAGTKTIL